MAQVISEGFEPQNLTFPMKAVIEEINGNDGSKKVEWLNRYFVSTDGPAYPRRGSEFSGEFVMVRDSELLKAIHPNTPLYERKALQLPSDEAYAELKGPRFKRATFGRQEYAILTPKFENIASDFAFDVRRGLFVPKNKPEDLEYWSKQLDDLNATPIGRTFGIDEVEIGDVWLGLSHFDFSKSPNDAANQAATYLRNNYLKSFTSPEDPRYKTHGTNGVYLASEERVPTLQTWHIFLDLGSISGGYDKYHL